MNYNDKFTNDIMKFDVECRSLWRAYEMVELKHDDMVDRIEYKLVTESGTYEDAILLYEEANKETSGNKEGILVRIKNAIKNFFKKIKEFFTGKSSTVENADDNKQYSLPGSVKEFVDHHFKLTGIVKDFNAWMDGGFKELPQTMKNARNILVFGGGTVAGGLMTGKKIKEVYNYAKGDVDAIRKLNNSLTKKIEAIEAKDDEDRSWIDTAKKKGYECIQDILSNETKFVNSIIGSVVGKVEGIGEKINEKSAEHIKNSKKYKDLIEKEKNGTLSESEKTELQKMKDSIEKKEDKAATHKENKEALSNLKDVGKISSTLSNVEKNVKKAKDKLSSGKINKDSATSTYNTNKESFENAKSTFETETAKGDKSRISESETKQIKESISRVEKLLAELNTAIGGSNNNSNANGNNEKKSESSSNSSSDKSNSDNLSDSSDSDTSSDNDSSDDTSSDGELGDKEVVDAWKVVKQSDGSYKVVNQTPNLKNQTGATIKSKKKRKKTLKKRNAKEIGLKDKTGMVWTYEEALDDWFDIDVETNSVFESYSGSLDDELMDILSEL